jgi:type II secretory pathway component PulJ
VKSSTDTLKASKLNHELSTALGVMTTDIRRAGYWGQAKANDLTNPFIVTSTSNLDIKNSGSCVLYTYDLNSDGSASTTAEYFGFKLLNNVLYMRTGAGTSTSDCTNGTWEAITDSKLISITNLSFTTTNSKCLNSTTSNTWTTANTTSNLFPCGDGTVTGYVAPSSGDILVETRQVTITIEGQLVSDSAVKKKLVESVRVRNDRIYKN